jgi:hypothetical protein
MTEGMKFPVKKLAIAAGALAMTGALAVLFLFDPTRVPIYPQCVFHQWTGLDCPGCGCLRATHALLHGDLNAALHFNPCLVLSLPLFAWIGFRFLLRRWKENPAPVIQTRWIWFYVGAWLLFGVLRNLPVPLFAAFVP